VIHTIWTLLAFELKLQLRQPAALWMLLLTPVLLGPGALIGGELMMSTMEAANKPTIEDDGSADDSQRWRIHAPPHFAEWLEDGDRIAIVGGNVPASGDIGDADAQASVTLEGRKATIGFRVDSSRSRSARDAVKEVLKRRKAALLDERFVNAGIAVAPDEVVTIAVEDHTTEAARAAGPFGVALPGLILLGLAMAATYTAVDLVTGEKERGTIETLLTSRADRRSVLLAKFGIVCGSAIVSGWVALASIWAVQLAGYLNLPTLLGADGHTEVPASALLLMGGAVVLLGFQMAGLAIVLATYAPDYKTASMISGPAMMFALTPSGIGAFPGIELNAGMALVPVANVALAFKDLLVGELGVGMLIWVAAASAAHGAVAIYGAWLLLGREEALIGSASGSERRTLGYYGRDAAILFVTAVLCMWFFGQLAQSTDPVWGMVFTQVVLFGGLAIAGVAYLGLPWRRTLSLGAPSRRNLALAVVGGVLAPGAGTTAMWLQSPLIPVPTALAESMGAALIGDHHLLTILVSFALLPAVFEELLFRGTLLGLVRNSLSTTSQVLVIALLFGMMHLSVIRLFPTGAFGLLATIAVIRSGSLWTAVVMHALNNGILLTIGYFEWTPPEGILPLVACVGAFAAVAGMHHGIKGGGVGV